MKKRFLLIFLVLIMLFAAACGGNTGGAAVSDGDAVVDFVDDRGECIVLDSYPERIISLYSSHTENLFALGAGDRVIGIGTSDSFPPAVRFRDIYDYKSDPEKIIAANPDVVLIRPHINSSNPEFVDALDNAGILTVSLYAGSLEEFPGYIGKLAELTGTRETAEDKLAEFWAKIDEVRAVTENISPKTRLFLERTEKNYRTVTPESMPGMAIDFAGGENLAEDAVPISEGSSIAEYGVERILEQADDIDVYISIRGTMGAGGNIHTITIRPGFDAIKAIREERVYNIESKLIASTNFRYADGIRELARMLYPDVFDSLEKFDREDPLTRSELAEMIVCRTHRPFYNPSTKYYRSEYKGHTYGAFEDVPVEHDYFHFIETAVMGGYIKGEKDEEDKEYFGPDEQVTREQLASAVYLMGDIHDDGSTEIKDADRSSAALIVKKVVGAGIMSAENGMFYPQKTVTEAEAYEIFMNMEK